MKLEEAEKLANEIIEEIKIFCEKIQVCGSIRRKASEINDVDIVLIPKEMSLLYSKLEGLGDTEVKGRKYIRFYYKGEQIDVYFAIPENFEILTLIRTGSANHNKKLCTEAIKKGLRLKFDKGLVDKNENIIANTEKEILENLLGRYVEPMERI